MLDTLVGQRRASLILRRVAVGALRQPLLLVGLTGVGKRTSALLATRGLFCQGTKTATCACGACAQVTQGIHPDMHVVQNEKSIGVDQIRELCAQLVLYPTLAPVHVVLLRNVDRMTAAAGNALLKTLEEPLSCVQFFLTAEQPNLVLPAIRSRCLELPYAKLPKAFIQQAISRWETDPEKALVLANLSDGSVGRAIQLWGSNRLALRDAALQLLRLASENAVGEVFSSIDDLKEDVPRMLPLLETIMQDLVLNPPPQACVHVDRQTEIAALRRKVPVAKWHRLRHLLAEVQDQAVPIHLAFAVKSSLVEALAEG